MKQQEAYSTFIKEEAKALGFLSCGIAKAGFLAVSYTHLTLPTKA